MRSLLLMSILVATVAIPVHAARDSCAGRGLRKAIVRMALFNVVYALACAYVFHRLP